MVKDASILSEYEFKILKESIDLLFEYTFPEEKMNESPDPRIRSNYNLIIKHLKVDSNVLHNISDKLDRIWLGEEEYRKVRKLQEEQFNKIKSKGIVDAKRVYYE